MISINGPKSGTFLQNVPHNQTFFCQNPLESAKLLTLLILLAADLNYPKPKINSSGLSLKSKPRNPEIHRTCILDLNQSLGNLLPKFGDSVLN